jgi:hypothetical protein
MKCDQIKLKCFRKKVQRLITAMNDSKVGGVSTVEELVITTNAKTICF